jgi:hypothetical protein
MSQRDQAARTDGEHGRAVQRLQEAVAQQRRLRIEHQAAKDTPGEMTVDSSLRAAEEQVTARERWLRSVDQHDY